MLAPTPTSAPRILVRLAATPGTKEAAIREAAELFTASGCIEAGYGESMLRREAVANSYLGHGVVIPHGMVDDRHLVRHSGLADGGRRSLARRADGPPRVAPDLAPSDTAGQEPTRVIGLATAQGGPTSHTAILAGTLGIRSVVAGGPGLLAVRDGTIAILDGTTGRLNLAWASSAPSRISR